MKSVRWLVLPAFVAVAASAGMLFGGGGGKLSFCHDYEKGMLEAKMMGKPTVVYFTASW